MNVEIAKDPRILDSAHVERLLENMPDGAIFKHRGKAISIANGDRFYFDDKTSSPRRDRVAYEVRGVLRSSVLSECVVGGVQTTSSDAGGFEEYAIDEGDHIFLPRGFVAERLMRRSSRELSA